MRRGSISRFESLSRQGSDKIVSTSKEGPNGDQDKGSGHEKEDKNNSSKSIRFDEQAISSKIASSTSGGTTTPSPSTREPAPIARGPLHVFEEYAIKAFFLLTVPFWFCFVCVCFIPSALQVQDPVDQSEGEWNP